MAKVFVALVVALFFMFPTTAQAQAQRQAHQCTDLNALKQDVAKSEGYSDFRKVAGRLTRDAADIFNSIHPNLAFEWNAAWLLNDPEGGGVMFVGFDDVVCFYTEFEERDWERLLRSLEGTAI